MSDEVAKLVAEVPESEVEVTNLHGTLILSFSFMAVVDSSESDLQHALLVRDSKLFKLAAKTFGKGFGGYLVCQEAIFAGTLRPYKGQDDRFQVEFDPETIEFRADGKNLLEALRLTKQDSGDWSEHPS